jgi:isopenicillin-N epimerase
MSEQVNSKNYNKNGAIDWEAVRSEFNLNKDYIHIGASQFIVSHPRYLHNAILYYMNKLDSNPTEYVQDEENKIPDQVRQAICNYFGVDDISNIALTDSATMGNGIIYTGLNIQAGKEILASANNHYSHQESIARATGRTGASFREAKLYKEIESVTAEEIIENLINEIKDNTRVIGVSWVNSDTGLKMPVGEISKELIKINQNRGEMDKILFIVDGVHGFGIELETFKDIGCDFFITDCHKWLYGPRGTGFVAATPIAWQYVQPVIPSFRVITMVAIEKKYPEKMDGRQMTPGGYHTFEHRWALKDAFEFNGKIGKRNIYERIHTLSRQCKEGLAAMKHVTLHTPIDDTLSSGIIAFEVNGINSNDFVQKLHDKKVIATVAPYQTEYVRFTPGIFNTPEEIDKVLEAVHSLKNA